MGERKAYPSDLSDQQWALVGPFLDAWKVRHPSVSGHQGRYELREIVNAIFYQNRTGCQWAYLPHDLPPKSATYYYFALWRDDGTDQAIHDLLRCQVREQAGRGRGPEPDRAGHPVDPRREPCPGRHDRQGRRQEDPAVDALGGDHRGGRDRGVGHRQRDRRPVAGQGRRAHPDGDPGVGGCRVHPRPGHPRRTAGHRHRSRQAQRDRRAPVPKSMSLSCQ
ncbi:transposase [Kutzneria sp. 744]|nr:transposase [Kutzneria sp. 744]